MRLEGLSWQWACWRSELRYLLTLRRFLHKDSPAGPEINKRLALLCTDLGRASPSPSLPGAVPLGLSSNNIPIFNAHFLGDPPFLTVPPLGNRSSLSRESV